MGSRLSLKFFELEAAACRADVEEKMRAVARELRERNQELLGSLLFSCNGRGPSRFLDLHGGGTAGIDARAFTAAFPNTAVAGFYCMGEIGPQSIWSEPAVEEAGGGPTLPSPLLVSPSWGSGSGGGGGGHFLEGGEEMLAASQTGSSALQGYTAVFGVWCVPKRGPRSGGSALMHKLHHDGTAAALACVLGTEDAIMATT